MKMHLMGARQRSLHLFNKKMARGLDKSSPQFKNTFGAKIKIMWEEQLVDPPIDNITSVNVRESSVLN